MSLERGRLDQVLSALALLISEHDSRNGADAYHLFLTVHLCVATRVQDSRRSPELLRLTRTFVSKALGVYQNNYKGSFAPQDIGPVWNVALQEYDKDPRAFITVLSWMALAHIVEDLQSSLREVDVDKSDFDSVFEHIEECLDNHCRAPVAQGFRDLIALRIVPEMAPKPIKKLRDSVWDTVDWVKRKQQQKGSP